jgi:hypothetical protein
MAASPPAPLFCFDLHEVPSSSQKAEASLLLFGPRSANNQSVCWRIIDIPHVVYIELDASGALTQEEDEAALWQALGALVAKPNTVPEEAVALARRTFAPPPPTTTRRFLAWRVEWSRAHRKIDWHATKCAAAWEAWRPRVHLEHATMTQRFLWDKDIGGACWLRATQPAAAAPARAFSTCTTEHTIYFSHVVRMEEQAVAPPPPPPLWTLTFAVAQRHTIETYPKAANIFAAGEVHNDEFYVQPLAPIDSIAIVLHATHLAPHAHANTTQTWLLTTNPAPAVAREAKQEEIVRRCDEGDKPNDAAAAAAAAAAAHVAFVERFANEADMLRVFFEQWVTRCDVLVAWQLQDLVLPLLLARLTEQGNVALWHRVGRVASAHLPQNGPVWKSWYESSHALPGGRLVCDAFRCVASSDLFPPHNCATIAQLEQTFLPVGLRLGPLPVDLATSLPCSPARVSSALPAPAGFSEHARRALYECTVLHLLLTQQSVVRVLYEVSHILGCRLRTTFDTTAKVRGNTC